MDTLCRGACPNASRAFSSRVSSRCASCRVVAEYELDAIPHESENKIYFSLVHYTDLQPLGSVPMFQPSLPTFQQYLAETLKRIY
jgi:hypothetical protein